MRQKSEQRELALEARELAPTSQTINARCLSRACHPMDTLGPGGELGWGARFVHRLQPQVRADIKPAG